MVLFAESGNPTWSKKKGTAPKDNREHPCSLSFLSLSSLSLYTHYTYTHSLETKFGGALPFLTSLVTLLSHPFSVLQRQSILSCPRDGSGCTAGSTTLRRKLSKKRMWKNMFKEN